MKDETQTTAPTTNDKSKDVTTSYWNLLHKNRSFFLYLSSFIVTHIGQWFTYVASISLIEQILEQQEEENATTTNSNNSSSKIAISILVIVKLLPFLIFMIPGGVLADARDRCQTMISLDIIGSILPLFYILAIGWIPSISLIYAIAFIQSTVAALYEPCSSALMPMLILTPSTPGDGENGDDENGDGDGGGGDGQEREELLKKATTLTGVAWSSMAAFGSALGGIAVAALGLQACFVLDCITFLASAFLLWLIGGSWNPTVTTTPTPSSSSSSPFSSSPSANETISELPIPLSPLGPHHRRRTSSLASTTSSTDSSNTASSLWIQFVQMSKEGTLYLQKSDWGSLVFLKCTDGFLFGSTDVLNVSFSEMKVSSSSRRSITNTDVRLGLLFAFMGFGSLLGPLASDPFTDMNRPKTLQAACIVGMAWMGMSYLGLGLLFDPFEYVYVLTLWKAIGSSILWIDSSILLQKFSSPAMMGRVFAIDVALVTFAEAISAFLTGFLQDHWHLSAPQVCLVYVGFCIIMTCIWGMYHIRGYGAANSKYNEGRVWEKKEEMDPLRRPNGDGESFLYSTMEQT